MYSSSCLHPVCILSMMRPYGSGAGEERSEDGGTRAWHAALRVSLAGAPVYAARCLERLLGNKQHHCDEGSRENEIDTQIGEAAGRICQYLREHGAVTLPEWQRGTTLSGSWAVQTE